MHARMITGVNQEGGTSLDKSIDNLMARAIPQLNIDNDDVRGRVVQPRHSFLASHHSGYVEAGRLQNQLDIHGNERLVFE